MAQEHGLTLAEIGELTRYQVSAIYFRKLWDKDGKLVRSRREPPREVSQEERWRLHWRRAGWPQWRISAWIAEQQAQQKRRK